MSHITLISSLLIGVAVHLLYFKRGEHHLYALQYLEVSTFAFATSVFLLSQWFDLSLRTSVLTTGSHTTSLLCGLFASLLTYRIYFNPLNKFAGPFWARITRLHIASLVFGKFNAHLILQRQHRQYGDFVRTGPNDLSTIHPDALQALHGPKTTVIKSPFYDVDYPEKSVQTSRSRKEHDQRRKHWAIAFGEKAQRGYEHRIESYIGQLLEKFRGFEGQDVDVTKWFRYFTFDVMGDLAFGSSFDMLRTGEAHWVTETIELGLSVFGTMFPNWLFRLLADLPFITASYQRMVLYCNKQIEARVERQAHNLPDVAHHLIEAMQKQPNRKKGMAELGNDSKLLIVAGSDTTSATLTNMFYYLAKDQELQQRLRSELFEKVKEGDEITNQKLQDAEVLNGCIYETLRLNPPVPSGLSRQTPKEGIMIGDTFIPGFTSIQIPSYVVGHDDTNYVLPEAFLPERWSTKPDLIKVKNAFAPFSIGPMNCIGRNVAMMEIRLLTAHLLRGFEVTLAKGEDGKRLFEGARDHFTVSLEPLKLVFNGRYVN